MLTIMKFLNTAKLANLPHRQVYKNLIKYVSDLCSIIFSFIITNYIIYFPAQERIFGDILFLSLMALLISYFLDIHRHLWRVTSFYNIRGIAKYSLGISLVYMVWCYFFGDSSEEFLKFFLVFSLFSFVLLMF